MGCQKLLIGCVWASFVSGCVFDGLESRDSVDFNNELNESAVESTKQSIINGDVLNSAPIAANMVEVPGCSAFAIDSEWVLTAAHCTPGLVNDSSTLSLFRPVPETKTLREFIAHPDENSTSGSTPYADIALLRVYTFVSPTLQAYQLWNGSLSPLIGSTLFCAGRGDNTFSGTGWGTWRFAYLSPSSLESSGYRIYEHPVTGQIQRLGDSGGACTYGSQVVGIQSSVVGGSGNASSYQVGLSATISGWIETTRQRSRLFFYRKSDGRAFVSALERNGTYTSAQQLSLDTQWTHVALLRNGAILFYNSGTGASAAGRLNKTTGGFIQAANFTLPSGMTHIVSVGSDRLFLFNRTAGVGRTARLTATGNYTAGQTVSGFSPFTHIVGTKSGGLFMYQSGSAVAGTATIDANLNYYFVGAVNGFATNWTHVTAVNERGIFLYNSSNGVGWTAELTPAGNYLSHSLVNGIGSGYSVVGATNGTLLFRNGVGAARLARVDASGTYTSLSMLSGFATDWTNVVAE